VVLVVEARLQPAPDIEPHEALAGILTSHFTRTNHAWSASPLVSARGYVTIEHSQPGASGEDQRLSFIHGMEKGQCR
jgi:hypothetical protein